MASTSGSTEGLFPACRLDKRQPVIPTASPWVTCAPIVTSCTYVDVCRRGSRRLVTCRRSRCRMAQDRQLAEVRFVTVAEVASLMRVSKMTVYRLVHSGELPAVRVGRSFRVPESAVHDYLRAAFIDTA